MEEQLLRVNHLTTNLAVEKKQVAIVDGVSFNLYKGKTLALVGESGCGKSMTALSLMQILPKSLALPSSGEVIFQGKNLLTFSSKEMRALRGSKIAMIFQDPSSALNPVFTIGNQLVEVANLHLNLYGDDAVNRAITTLREVGIAAPEERFNDYPHQLSGGMRQRVMIAMALMCEPLILIADEPTTALDVTIQAQILNLIRKLQKEKQMALLLITHDMGIVAEMADDVIVMYAAENVEQGSLHDIFENMSHPYTKALFSARRALYAPREKLNVINGNVPSPLHFPKGCRFHPRCPYAMDKCKEGKVPSFTILENRHFAKCWLYDGTKESEEMKMRGIP